MVGWRIIEPDLDIDAVFASVQFARGSATALNCMQAIARTDAKFHQSFPGWALYRRLLIGDELLDRDLMAFAITMARILSRSRKITGYEFVAPKTRANDWIRQAALDALDLALFRREPEGVNKRAERFEVSGVTYQKVRDTVGHCMEAGIEQYRGELHRQFRQLFGL